jgi:putative transposase
MPRQARISVPGIPYHVYQRSVNGDDCYRDVQDREIYLRYLLEARIEHGCPIHAYVLMTNHVHFLLTPETSQSMPGMMRLLSGRYAQYFNAKYERTGHLWANRYHSVPVETDAYFFACQRYIELNPVRARMVDHPGDYLWSSYGANAGHGVDRIVSPHELYLMLATSLTRRHQAYRNLFEDVLPGEANQIFEATVSGQPIGSDRFRGELEQLLGVQFRRGRRKRRNRAN